MSDPHKSLRIHVAYNQELTADCFCGAWEPEPIAKGLKGTVAEGYDIFRQWARHRRELGEVIPNDLTTLTPSEPQ